MVFTSGKTGETYVIGGNCERNNLYVADKICDILDRLKPKQKGSYKEQITFVKDRPGHDNRYAIDASKIKKELGWVAKVEFDLGLKRTVEWFLKKYQKV